MRLQNPKGSWTVIPADVGDITLSNDGKYHFATGYTGTVTITATNVALSGELKNSAIQFTNSGVNVYANGLSIKNDTNTGKSMIAFSGGANLLQIGTSGLKLYSDVDAGGKAGLNIGEELDIQVPDRIDSLNVYTEGSGAGIGTDAGKAAKQLRISGMGNTDIRDVSVGCGGSGAGIGTGTHGYLNRIIVENTSLDVASQGDGAAIGCGQGNSSVDHLWIEDCKGAMDTTYGDHEVPVGQDQSETGTIGNIYTRGNQVDYITGKLPESWNNNPLTLQTGITASSTTNFYLNELDSNTLGLDVVDIKTRQGAKAAIKRLDTATNYVLGEQTRIGGYLSRLSYTTANLTIASENITSAESTIRDADLAKEMIDYTRSNVLGQASQLMLAQANQNSSSVLELLKEG